MVRRPLIIALILIVALALIAPGCAGTATPTAPSAAPTTSTVAATPAATAASTPATTATPSQSTATGPIKVTDSTGATVELPKLPQRIVVVGQGPYMPLHTLFMFPEAKQRVIGMERKSTAPSDFLPFVDPTFTSKSVLDMNPGPEQIATLKPDLVICKGTVKDRLSDPLQKLGIPVVQVGLENPEMLFKDIANIGILFGNEARAKEIIAFYKTKLDRISQRVASIDQKGKPTMLTLEYTNRGGPVAVNVPAKTYMQTIQAQATGANLMWLAAATGDGWTIVNFEQIATWNPDKIFLVVWYTMDPAQVIAGLKTDPQWKGLKAVQNGQVYAYPSDLYGWDSPDPRWILGMTWLAQKVNPTAFSDVDMNQEVYEFFSKIYGLDKASVDKNLMPKVNLDLH